MNRSRAVAALALFALLLLAGCQAPGTPQEPGFGADITVINATGVDQGTTIPVAGNETVDPAAVFARVETALSVDVEPPKRVRVLDDLDDLSANVSTFESPIRRHLNVTRRGTLNLGDQENGAVSILGTITIYPGQARDPRATTWVLAHELVHYVQVRSGVEAALREEIGIATTDGQFTHRAMLEGAAVYTTEAYTDEHLPGATTTLDLYRSVEAGLPPGSAGTYANRQYLLGYRYVRNQVDSPAELSALYDETALTSEHLIHGFDQAAEPMARLDVAYEGDEAWTVTGRDRMGEAFVWTALEDRLGTDRAAAVAAGWGNDTLLTVYPTDVGNASFAWVLRWDDAANATEFAAGAREYVDRAGTATDNATRLESGAHVDVATAGARTTVVLIGERQFVTGTQVEASDGRVSLSTTDTDDR